MKIEIRLYKQHDADLIALASNGYQIATMMHDAISGYANGSPIHFYLDEPIMADFNIIKTFRTRFSVSNAENNALYLLQGIKHGYRNLFCKMVLREALVQQNLSAFFSNDYYSVLMQFDANTKKHINLAAYTNVIMASKYKQSKYTLATSITPHVAMPIFSGEAPSLIPVQNIQPMMQMGTPQMAYMSPTQAIQPVHPQSSVPAYNEPVVTPKQTDMQQHDSIVQKTNSTKNQMLQDIPVQNTNEKPLSAILNVEADSDTMSALDRLMDNAFD